MHDAATPSDSPPVEAPAPLGRTLLFALFALTAGLGLTNWMDQTGSETLTAILHAHTATIAASRDSHIGQVLADEGQVLTGGQPVVVLADDGFRSRLSQKRLDAATLKVELKQARAKAEVDLDWRIKNLDDEILQTRLKSANLLKEHFTRQIEGIAWQEFLDDYDAGDDAASGDEIFKPVLYRVPAPNETRIRAMLQHEAARNAVEVFAVQVKMCDQRLEELKKLKRELPAKIHRAMGVDVAETRLKQALEEISALDERERELTLSTPTYGTVGVFRKRAGDRVAAGEPIVEILDQDRRFLVLEVPSRQVGGFAAGTVVDLLFPGGEERSGKVRGIPPQTVGSLRGDRTLDNRDTLVPVHIDPIDKLWPHIPIGSSVEVTLAK